jgi:ubiquinone/menaquinone biosynthesis C-methylase UbiE
VHDSVMAWVRSQVEEYDLADGDTLEVGSLDVNGSVRSLFTGHYTGLDMRDGPGVDIVGKADELPFVAARFDVVVSTEMLEHDPSPWLSLAEMGRVLKQGGHLLVTTRGNGFGEHNEPSDFFRFMPASMPLLLAMAKCEPLVMTTDPEVPGIFMHGVRT